MEEKNCYTCNTITGNKYKVTNAEEYFICSDNCLQVLIQMKSFLYFIHFYDQRYGPLIPIKDIQYILEGWLKPMETKKYIEELINRGFLAKRKDNFVEIIR